MAIRLSVTSGEFVSPDFPLWLEGDADLDATLSIGEIALGDRPAAVALRRDRRRITVTPGRPLAPGPHALVVPAAAGSGHTTRTVTFYVVDARYTIPRMVRVGSYARFVVRGLRVDRVPPFERPAGEYYDLLKSTHRVSGRAEHLGLDRDGRRYPVAAMLDEIERERVRRAGKLHPALTRWMTASHEPVEAAFWLAFEADGEASEQRHLARIARTTEAFAGSGVFAEVGAVATPDPRAPVVYATLSPDAIRAVARHPAVRAVYHADKRGVLDLVNAKAAARVPEAHATGATGEGVKVAVFEDGPGEHALLEVADSRSPAAVATPDREKHSLRVHAILKNGSAVPGVAQGCALYSTRSLELTSLDWALSKGCSVINQSFHRPTEPGSAVLSFDDVYKDWLAINPPYPTIVHAAGNLGDGDVDAGDDEYVNHKGYNTIAVGSHRDDPKVLSKFSAFLNPTSPRGDRELPEICAGGHDVAVLDTSASGTSYAAPLVAGCVALMQAADPTRGLVRSPAACRAILLAAATRHASTTTWAADVATHTDAAEGAGALDALASVEIARVKAERNNAACQRGWHAGSLAADDIYAESRSTTFGFNVLVPKGDGPTGVLKVALAWSSEVDADSAAKVSATTLSKLTVDLDLKVFDADAALLASSESYDNSYEVVVAKVERGKVYTVRLVRWSSAAAKVSYAVAWTAA